MESHDVDLTNMSQELEFVARTASVHVGAFKRASAKNAETVGIACSMGEDFEIREHTFWDDNSFKFDNSLKAVIINEHTWASERIFCVDLLF